MLLRRAAAIGLAGLALAVTIPLPVGEVAPHAIAPTICPSATDNATVAIRDDFFDPETVYVGRGNYVNWTNAGPEHPHTTTGPGWDSGSLDVDQSFAHRFCTVGTFEYLCTIHGFTGKVVVNL